MTGLFVLIPVALFLGLLGLVAFLWSLKSGQFDDLDGAAARAIQDIDPAPVLERQSSGEQAPRQRKFVNIA